MLFLVQLLSFAGILAALISLIRPMRILGIRTRRTALGVLAACFATFLVSAVADGSAQQRDQTPRQVADTAAESRAMDDGCKLAGVIPNCEAEVAKAVARQAALPKPPAPPAPAASRGGDGTRSAISFSKSRGWPGWGTDGHEDREPKSADMP